MNPEKIEQMTVLEYCHSKNIFISATPNETPSGSMQNGKWRTNWKSVRDAKDKGVSAGFPDLTIIAPCGDGKNRMVFIEMKAPSEKIKIFFGKTFREIQKEIFDTKNWEQKNGETKKSFAGVKFSQMQWLTALDTATECGAYVCYSGNEAIEILEWLKETENFS